MLFATPLVRGVLPNISFLSGRDSWIHVVTVGYDCGAKIDSKRQEGRWGFCTAFSTYCRHPDGEDCLLHGKTFCSGLFTPVIPKRPDLATVL